MTNPVPDPNAEALPRAARLPLIGGALAFDFANTASGRGGPEARDHLTAPDHVLLWAEHAGILDASAAAALRARVIGPTPEIPDLLDRALELRECVHAIASAVAAHTPPDADALTRLSTLTAAALAAATLAAQDGGFRWTWPTDPPGLWTVLGPIALSAVGLLRDGDLHRLKQCHGEHCGWIFFDTSKNNSRRWCEMSVCGNRAKQKTFAKTAKRRASD